MLVSAISANPIQMVRVNNTEPTTVVKSGEAGDTAFNSLTSYIKALEMEKLFDSINEWKYFCHKQISKGNFDIIA